MALTLIARGNARPGAGAASRAAAIREAFCRALRQFLLFRGRGPYQRA